VQVISGPVFTVTSTPAGAELFVTIDAVLGEYTAMPLAAHCCNNYLVTIAMAAPKDSFNFSINVPIVCTDIPTHTANLIELSQGEERTAITIVKPSGL
jgi:hypothetical protein